MHSPAVASLCITGQMCPAMAIHGMAEVDPNLSPSIERLFAGHRSAPISAVLYFTLRWGSSAHTSALYSARLCKITMILSQGCFA